jgi:hypothetical protein
LLLKSREERPVREERVEATEPVKRFKESLKYDNLVISPREEGMGPTRQLLTRLR